MFVSAPGEVSNQTSAPHWALTSGKRRPVQAAAAARPTVGQGNTRIRRLLTGLAVEAYQTTAGLLERPHRPAEHPGHVWQPGTGEVRADPRVSGSDLTGTPTGKRGAFLGGPAELPSAGPDCQTTSGSGQEGSGQEVHKHHSWTRAARNYQQQKLCARTLCH